jgi:hypothetical protein
MSDFTFRTKAAGGGKTRTPPQKAEVARESTVFVDVAERSTRAQVSRGGLPLGETPVNAEAISSFLDERVVVQTKTVRQSIQPGTAVARGTAIDIVLADAADLPVRVIPNVHAAFQDLTMKQLNDKFATNAVVRDIVRRRTGADELTAAERETLTSAFQAANVPINPNAPVEAAFAGVRAAFTFQG